MEKQNREHDLMPATVFDFSESENTLCKAHFPHSWVNQFTPATPSTLIQAASPPRENRHRLNIVLTRTTPPRIMEQQIGPDGQSIFWWHSTRALRHRLASCLFNNTQNLTFPLVFEFRYNFLPCMIANLSLTTNCAQML